MQSEYVRNHMNDSLEDLMAETGLTKAKLKKFIESVKAEQPPKDDREPLIGANEPFPEPIDRFIRTGVSGQKHGIAIMTQGASADGDRSKPGNPNTDPEAVKKNKTVLPPHCAPARREK